MAETEAVKLGIEIMSMETLKPSSSAPSNHTTYTLSVLDQTFPATHFDILLVYNNSTAQTKLDIPHLKCSLMETLSRFYPFAGRCDNESTVSCNDKGVPFLMTRVDCALSDAFNLSGGFGSFLDLLPPVDLISARRRPVSELVPLAFQINVFTCGGVVIGCYMLHKVMDSASFGTFLKYWAGLVTKQTHQNLVLVEPDFRTAVSAFPPSPKVNKFTVTVTGIYATVLALGNSIRVVAKSFMVNTPSLTDLKVKATSDELPNPTRFEALAGFVWEQAFAATCDAGAASPASPTQLRIAANIRSRTNPPLPQGSIGNLVVDFPAQVDNQTGFSDLAIKIHKSLASTEIIEVFKGEDGAEAVIAYRKALFKEVLECKPYFYKLSSWSNLGFDQADFGFGKPGRIIPFTGRLMPIHRNFIFFNDYASPTENGIEVRLILEEKEMQILESNPVFLASAVRM